MAGMPRSRPVRTRSARRCRSRAAPSPRRTAKAHSSPARRWQASAQVSPGRRARGSGFGAGPRRGPVHQSQGPAEGLSDPLAAAGRRADHRHAQGLRKGRRVHGDALLLRLVQQVHAQHRPGLHRQDLQREGQAPPKAGAVQDHDAGVRPAGSDEVRRRPLLLGHGPEGVGPRHVHQGEGPPVHPGRARLEAHGLARPVARVLPKARGGVEQGALAHVGVAAEAHDGGHTSATATVAASFCRRAMTVSHTQRA